MTKNRTPTPVYLDPGMHPGLEVKGLRSSSKHEALIQCRFNFGPPSSTLVQHRNSIGWMPCISFIMIHTWLFRILWLSFDNRDLRCEMTAHTFPPRILCSLLIRHWNNSVRTTRMHHCCFIIINCMHNSCSRKETVQNKDCGSPVAGDCFVRWQSISFHQLCCAKVKSNNCLLFK